MREQSINERKRTDWLARSERGAAMTIKVKISFFPICSTRMLGARPKFTLPRLECCYDDSTVVAYNAETDHSSNPLLSLLVRPSLAQPPGGELLSPVNSSTALCRVGHPWGTRSSCGPATLSAHCQRTVIPVSWCVFHPPPLPNKI